MALSAGPGGGEPPPEAVADDPAGPRPDAVDDDTELVLPCGRTLHQVWADAREGRTDAHTEACPSCQEALAEFAVLQRTTDRLRSEEVDVPAGLGRAVMGRVRTELRLGRLIPLGRPEEHACVAESAVATVLRAAADRVRGTRARGCRVTPLRDATGAAVPGPVSVQVEISVAYGVDIPEAAAAVRTRVVRAARDSVGIDVGSVHVTAVDLWDDASDADAPARGAPQPSGAKGVPR